MLVVVCCLLVVGCWLLSVAFGWLLLAVPLAVWWPLLLRVACRMLLVASGSVCVVCCSLRVACCLLFVICC